MNNVLVIFVCFLVIMAILVGAGFVQDRGFFGNTSQLYDSAVPFLKTIESSFRAFFGVGREVGEDEIVLLERYHFTYGDRSYYADVISPAVGKSFLGGHNYDSNLILEKYGVNAHFFDENGNTIARISTLSIGKKREWASVRYSYYLECVKNTSGRLKEMNLPDVSIG